MNFDAVWACARLLLAGQVLHAEGLKDKDKIAVTAAAGDVLVRDASGRALIIVRGLDAYDAAEMYVRQLGPERALRSARARGALPTRGRVEWIV